MHVTEEDSHEGVPHSQYITSTGKGEQELGQQNQFPPRWSYSWRGTWCWPAGMFSAVLRVGNTFEGIFLSDMDTNMGKMQYLCGELHCSLSPWTWWGHGWCPHFHSGWSPELNRFTFRGYFLIFTTFWRRKSFNHFHFWKLVIISDLFTAVQSSHKSQPWNITDWLKIQAIHFHIHIMLGWGVSAMLSNVLYLTAAWLLIFSHIYIHQV